jgi:hypothetical protein
MLLSKPCLETRVVDKLAGDFGERSWFGTFSGLSVTWGISLVSCVSLGTLEFSTGSWFGSFFS